MKSKEDKVLQLFFNHPTRRWHFTEVRKETGLPDASVDHWLKKFREENLIRRIKKKGTAPVYVSNYNAPEYQGKKRIAALEQVYESGLFKAVCTPRSTAVIFGSFSRSDWHSNSDIDLFICGPDVPELSKYEKRLQRDIQLFHVESSPDLKKWNKGVVHSILQGQVLCGDLSEVIYATT